MPSNQIPRSTWPILAFIIMSITILLIAFPQEGFEAAKRGVVIWWEVLFPSLFPFFIISELLLGFGIVHFVGTMLDPMMRPVFRVPGIGGFVMAMGFASGYPIGARLTAHLWEHKLVNRIEGERLVAFTTTSDPIFLIGVVSIGFFHNAQLAIIFAIAHYGGAVILGLLARFYGKPIKHIPPIKNNSSPFLLIRAFEAMHKARIDDGRTISIMLLEAIRTSLKLIFVVGGLVIFFSVILELLSLANIMSLLHIMVNFFFQWFYIPEALSQAIVNGLFEVTLGVRTAGNSGQGIALVHQVAIGAFILSWAGLSVHAQVASLLTHTNVRYRPFLIARFVHGLISSVLVYTIWDFITPRLDTVSAMIPFIPEQNTQPFSGIWPWGLLSSISIFIAVLLFIPLCAILIFLVRKIGRLLFYR